MIKRITRKSAYDRLWRDFRKQLANQVETAPLVMQLPAKRDVKRAMRAKSYALANYPHLESIGAFTFMLTCLIQIADAMHEQGHDVDSVEFHKWLAEREGR